MYQIVIQGFTNRKCPLYLVFPGKARKYSEFSLKDMVFHEKREKTVNFRSKTWFFQEKREKNDRMFSEYLCFPAESGAILEHYGADDQREADVERVVQFACFTEQGHRENDAVDGLQIVCEGDGESGYRLQ